MMARCLFVMALAMALATTLTSAATPKEEEARLTTASSFDEPLASENGSPSAGGMSAQHHPGGFRTCDKYPRVCHAPGSDGPDCCRKKCVNVMWDNANCGRCGRRCLSGRTCCRGKCVNVKSDSLNCGRCGNRCEYGRTCCNGQMVNVMDDPRHCGACNNKCNKGLVCEYGTCGYAY